MVASLILPHGVVRLPFFWSRPLRKRLRWLSCLHPRTGQKNSSLAEKQARREGVRWLSCLHFRAAAGNSSLAEEHATGVRSAALVTLVLVVMGVGCVGPHSNG